MDRVLIQSNTLALPLVEEIYREVLERGAVPVLRLEFPDREGCFKHHASAEVLEHVHAADLAQEASFSCILRILAPQASQYPFDALKNQHHNKRTQQLSQVRTSKRWCITPFPTAQGAELAGLSLEAFEMFVAQSMFLDNSNPRAQWEAMGLQQAKLIDRLGAARELHILAPETDLRLKVTDRTWVNSNGKRNMPSGEVFTGPIENSATGHIFFDIPTLYQERKVKGVRLVFEQGRVVSATADEGEDVLHAALETDVGARFLGEIGIGTNVGIQQCTQQILFDEKIKGTVHLALGRSYPETGGCNQSAIHWDLICDLRMGGQILLDGQLFQDRGQFV